MADTKIEWCGRPGRRGRVWNIVTGCTPASEGCRNCYAARMSKRLAGRCGYPADDPFRVTLHPDKLDDPFHWKKPSDVFVDSMGDLFHADVPDSFIIEAFARMWWAPEHTFIILTKRPDRMPDLMPLIEADLRQREQTLAELDEPTPLTWPLPNVWLIASVENQEAADRRVRDLLRTPAAVHGVSCEPLLGLTELDNICTAGTREGTGEFINALSLEEWSEAEARAEMGEGFLPTLDWVIAGGETGPGARPAHPEWFRSLRDQCKAAGVPFFFKSFGDWKPIGQMEDGECDALYHPAPQRDSEAARCCKVETTVLQLDGSQRREWPLGAMLMFRVGKKRAGRVLDGREYSEFPEVAG